MSVSSIAALQKQIDSGNIDTDKAYILSLIQKNDLTIDNLETILTIQYSTITARISDLQDLGLIYVKHSNNKGRFSVYAYESCMGKQSFNRADREKLRFQKWVKKSKDFNRFLSTDEIEFITNLI